MEAARAEPDQHPLERGAQVSRATRRLVVWIAAGAALAVILVVALVALVTDIVQRPSDITDFGRLCSGGAGFPKAAPYQGPGPHPIAVYEAGIELSQHPVYTAGDAGGVRAWPRPDRVQLVGCRVHVGRGQQIKTCPYTGGPTLRVYQGRWRVDVVEARTGRAVTSATIDGASTWECARVVTVPSDATPAGWTRHTTPEKADYAAQLSSLVEGSPR